MAYTTINKSTDYFNTKLYAGNSSTNAVTGVGFQPDWVWIKNRSNTSSHNIFDAVRGVTKAIFTNASDAEATEASRLSAFNSDGFTINGDTSNQTNANGSNFVSWNWKAGGTGSANTAGDINSTVSANTTAGFSVVTWTANGSTNDTVGHGLGAEPKIIIYKRYDAVNDWYVVYKFVDDSLDFIKLNTTDAKQDLNIGTYGFASSTTFTNLGFANSQQVVAYAFAEKRGYSKFGSYVGNGNASGSFVYTGFKPAFILTKKANASGTGWGIFDNKREGAHAGNPTKGVLTPNTNGAEFNTDRIDILSNGFKPRYNWDFINGSGNTYIYMAFAEAPLVGSNNIPATAR